MNGQYLIPANSKRSMLILGLFTVKDLIIFSVGAVISFALLFTIKTNTIGEMLAILSPVLVSSAMVTPVPNHGNVWQLTVHIYQFYTCQRKYRWKGWCVTNGEEENRTK